jgi:esterase
MQLHFSKIGEGPALVILHGLYGQGDNWLNIAHMLANKFTVYLVDQRNHGQSPHALSHSYDDLAGDIKEFCNNEGLTNFDLLGHSMGGKTAMTFALKYHDYVQRLIVVDISPYSYLNQKLFEPQINFHHQVIEAFKNAPVESAKSRAEIDVFFSNLVESAPIRKFLLKNLKRNKEGRFYWQLNIDAISKNLENIIDTVPPVKIGILSQIPALFIRGGKSIYITDEEILAVPDVFPNARFITFENAGHWLHAEEPKKFSEIVCEFLKS